MLDFLWVVLGLILACGVVPFCILAWTYGWFTTDNRLKITTPIYKGVTAFRCKRWNDGTMDDIHDPSTCEFCKKYGAWKENEIKKENQLVAILAQKYVDGEVTSQDIINENGYDLWCKVDDRARNLRQSERQTRNREGGTVYTPPTTRLAFRRSPWDF